MQICLSGNENGSIPCLIRSTSPKLGQPRRHRLASSEPLPHRQRNEQSAMTRRVPSFQPSIGTPRSAGLRYIRQLRRRRAGLALAQSQPSSKDATIELGTSSAPGGGRLATSERARVSCPSQKESGQDSHNEPAKVLGSSATAAKNPHQ